MFLRWKATVSAEMFIFLPIRSSVQPLATRFNTSCSRSLSSFWNESGYDSHFSFTSWKTRLKYFSPRSTVWIASTKEARLCVLSMYP